MAELGLGPFSLDSGGGGLWFVQETIAGGRRVQRSGLEYRPLRAEGIKNVSLDSSHLCFLMGPKGMVFWFHEVVSKSKATE